MSLLFVILHLLVVGSQNCYSWLFDLETQERAHSSSVRDSGRQIEVPNESVVETGKFQAFINEEVLVGIVNVHWTHPPLLYSFIPKI